MSDLALPLRGFWNLLGLEPRGDRSRTTTFPLEIAEAGIDPRTGGAIAVTTRVARSEQNGSHHLKSYCWRMLPSGKQASYKLFDIEFEPTEESVPAADGGTSTLHAMTPRAVWVLGRKVYDAADDADVDEPSAHSAKQRQILRVLGAVGEVNRQLRDGHLPNIANIFQEYTVHDAVGERLSITGQSPTELFDFQPYRGKQHEHDSITVPDTVARALMGYGVNTLDAHQQLDPAILDQAVDKKSGDLWAHEGVADQGEEPQVTTSLTPVMTNPNPPLVPELPEGEERRLRSTPRLTHVAWEKAEEGRLRLRELGLLNQDMGAANHRDKMRALGVTNRILHEARQDAYPATIDHLVDYDLHHMIDQFDPPPPLDQGGRFSMVSVGGNNMEPGVDGFAETIGGNSKVLFHEGLDQNGNRDRVGVIIDLGLHLSPKDEPNIAAAPDVIEHLNYCDHILLTHRHLDHTDGLFAYIAAGYMRNKTVHATPEVIRALRDKQRNFPGIHDDLMPTLAPLEGEGWLHIKDNRGNTRLSVNYARNATPHSARGTPFIVHGHYQGHWLGSYLNPGDARFGRHNADDYTGKPVEGDHLNKQFFTHTGRRFMDEIGRYDPQMAQRFHPSVAQRNPTYYDMDLTSVLKQGWAPTEPEVENNLVTIGNWFKDKGLLLAMISTNDNRFETALRMGTRLHRDITEFGTNLQKTATTMNVLGVNDLVIDPIGRQNIQHYLDNQFAQRLHAKIARQKEERDAAGDTARPAIEAKLERNEARLAAFEVLRSMQNASQRYRKRAELERELADRFGRSAQLGSMVEDLFLEQLNHNIADHETLLVTADEDEKPAIQTRIDRDRARLNAWEEIKAIEDPKRYGEALTEKQIALNEMFGESATLGLTSEDLEEDGLGSIRVGRTSGTARRIMSMDDGDDQHGPDGRRLGLLTGTQGTNVEVDAALTALAEGRHPVLNGNRKNSHTARPVIPGNNVVIISQSAIPGNDRKQDELVRKLVAQGYMVVQSIHDGFKLHGLDDAHRETITRALEQSGIAHDKEGDALVVTGMPIHAGGHGHQKDCEAWLKMVHADVTAAQHTSSPQAGKRLSELCAQTGNRYMGRVVPNFEGIAIDAGVPRTTSFAAQDLSETTPTPPQTLGTMAAAALTKITSIGRIMASLVRIEIMRKPRQYHSGHWKGTRLIRTEIEGGLRSDGLRATTRRDGVYELAFAQTDHEEAVRRFEEHNPGRPEPLPMDIPPERAHRGPAYPGEEFRLRLFGRAEETGSGFVRS